MQEHITREYADSKNMSAHFLFRFVLIFYCALKIRIRIHLHVLHVQHNNHGLKKQHVRKHPPTQLGKRLTSLSINYGLTVFL